jgi:hypothetical protein
MAINFGEVFLREMGSAQDRASNMAELQLQANKFAAQQALAEAQFEVQKADAASARSFRRFQEEIGRSQEERAQAQEERAVKMFGYEEELAEINIDKAEYERDKAQLNLQTLEDQQEYLNSIIPQEKAEKYNLPLTTTNQEYAAYLEQAGQETELNRRQFELQVAKTAMEEATERKELGQRFTKEFIEEADQEITLKEAPRYAQGGELGLLGRIGAGIGELATTGEALYRSLGAISPFYESAKMEDVIMDPFDPRYDPQKAAIRRANEQRLADIEENLRLRDKYRFERQTGIRQEVAEEVVGKKPSELAGFTPEMLQFMLQSQIQGTSPETVFGVSSSLFQGMGVTTPTGFMQQLIQSQQQTPPEVEE